MPFEKGNKLSPGRPTRNLEWEEEQEMRKHLHWLFAYIKAVRSGKSTERQDKAYVKLEKVLLKIMDKLHANKQQTEITGSVELPFTIKIVRDDREDNKTIPDSI